MTEDELVENLMQTARAALGLAVAVVTPELQARFQVPGMPDLTPAGFDGTIEGLRPRARQLVLAALHGPNHPELRVMLDQARELAKDPTVMAIMREAMARGTGPIVVQSPKAELLERLKRMPRPSGRRS